MKRNHPRHPDTLRRELKRIEAIIRRSGLSDIDRTRLAHYRHTLNWALGRAMWTRPSECLSVPVRKGNAR